MDEDTSSQFMSSMVKSIQEFCAGSVKFSSSIEVIGHIHLNIDRSVMLDYVLTEEVNKSPTDDAAWFTSQSYHSHPQVNVSVVNMSESANQGHHEVNQEPQTGNLDSASANTEHLVPTLSLTEISNSSAGCTSSTDSGEGVPVSSFPGLSITVGSRPLLSVKQEAENGTGTLENSHISVTDSPQNNLPAVTDNPQDCQNLPTVTYTHDIRQLTTEHLQENCHLIMTCAQEDDHLPVNVSRDCHQPVSHSEENSQPAVTMQENYHASLTSSQVVCQAVLLNTCKPTKSQRQDCVTQQSEGAVGTWSQRAAAKTKHTVDRDSAPRMDQLELKVEAIEETPDCYHDDAAFDVTEAATSDLSNMVLEQLDHQIDGTQFLMAAEEMQPQLQPFPIMLHTNSEVPELVSSDAPTPTISASSSPSCDIHASHDTQQDSSAASTCADTSRRHTGKKGKNRKHVQLKDLSRKSKLLQKKGYVQKKDSQSKAATARAAFPRKDSSGVKRTYPKPAAVSVHGVSKPRGPTHIMQKVPWTNQKKRPRKPCAVCKKKGIRQISCYFCPRCPEHPGYCRVRNCFTKHHRDMGLKFVPPKEKIL